MHLLLLRYVNMRILGRCPTEVVICSEQSIDLKCLIEWMRTTSDYGTEKIEGLMKQKLISL